jgi:hypothetical protein
MSEPRSNKRARYFRFFAFAFCAVVGVYSLYLRSQAITLENVQDILRSKLEDQQRRKLRLETLVAGARAIQSQQSAEMNELRKLQKRVTTKDQFLVTSGDKIVRQLAVYAPSSERRMILYVPAGNHCLVYAIKEVLGTPAETYSALANWGNDHRQIQDTKEIPLVGETVYELRTVVKKGTDSSIGIQLFGPEDNAVHEDSFPLSHVAFQGLNNWQNDSEILATYPNEIRSAGDAKTHVDAKKSAPVTPLLTFTLDHLGGKDQDSKGRVKMRFWIDSDSPPCMSDISVAVSYDFLSSNLRHAPQLTKSQAITKAFKSYDGSSRYYFAEGYFDGAVIPLFNDKPLGDKQ